MQHLLATAAYETESVYLFNKNIIETFKVLEPKPSGYGMYLRSL